MAEKKANEAVLHIVKTLQETNEKIAESAVAAQERNIKFAQSTLMSSVEVLKSQADSPRIVAECRRAVQRATR